MDDAVWLLPFVAATAVPSTTRYLHAGVCVMTLTSLAVVSCGIARIAVVVVVCATTTDAFTTTTSNTRPKAAAAAAAEHILEVLGAIVCWLIAILLFVRQWLKRRQRRRMRQRPSETQRLLKLTPDASHGSCTYDGHQKNATEHDDDDDNNATTEPLPTSFSPWTVILLTTLGALDELSYFPTLLMGHVVSPAELVLGTCLAAIVVVGVVMTCLSQVQPLVDCFDRIPLYRVVALFASILTVQAIIVE